MSKRDRKSDSGFAGVGKSYAPWMGKLAWKIGVLLPPEPRKPHKKQRIPGCNITARATIPFSVVQECRRLHEQEGLGPRAIAEKMNLSEGTVSGYIYYKLRQFR